MVSLQGGFTRQYTSHLHVRAPEEPWVFFPETIKMTSNTYYFLGGRDYTMPFIYNVSNSPDNVERWFL